MQQGGAQSKGAANSGRSKDGNINVASEDGLPPAEQSFPARLQITIEKDGVQGALQVESIVRDGEVVTENVHYFPDAATADAKNVEAEVARRSLYVGPPFANLDEDLQVLIDRYVAERGIDTALAIWVPDYVDYKEQREYVAWLSRKYSVLCSHVEWELIDISGVKDFVDA